MYFATVIATMVVLPIVSIVAERVFHPETALILLIGRWFVFWGAGVRLLLAGLRQTLQPEFTARQIFHMTGDEALPVIRELGFANISAGVVGLLSLAWPVFLLPAAVYAAIYYGAAGIGHVRERDRSANENLAMATDFLICVVLAIFVVASAARLSS